MIRTADLSDIDGICDVLAAAFKLDRSGASYKKKTDGIPEEIDQWRVMEEAGRIIGVVRIGRDRLKIGKSILIKGDVGQVGIHTECQASGLGTELMIDTVKWMRDTGYDLSRLGGLAKFYSRFGYVRFPRRYVEFWVGDQPGVGGLVLSDDPISIPETDLARIRKFDPERDNASFDELYAKFAEVYNCNLEKQSPAPVPLSMVYEEDGELTAYVCGVESETDSTEFQTKMSLPLVVFDPEKLQGLGALAAWFHNLSMEKNIQKMAARIPFDSRVFAALSAAHLPFRANESYGGMSANMMQIPSLKALMEHMIPEFEERMKSSLMQDWNGVLEIRMEDQAAALEFGGGKILPVEGAKADVAASFTQTELLGALLGTSSYDEMRVGMPKDKARDALLGDLFPKILSSSGVWG